MLSRPVVLQQPAARPKKVLPLPVVLHKPAFTPKNVLELPLVLEKPAQAPMKLLKQPSVLQKPALRPIKVLKLPPVLLKPAQRPAKKLLLPVVLQRPALRPAKKLLVPVLPVPLIQLTILFVPHTLNALGALNGAPLILNPVASTLNLSVVPAANITVLHKPAVPSTVPMIKLQPPVTTAQPARRPMKLLYLPMVLF
jgi:hypothetical protein